MVDEDGTDEWPLSNYPILLALILLVSTTIALGIGKSEVYANQLAVYAYFLLVIGVIIRFFELTLPESLVQKVKAKLLPIKISRTILKSEVKSGDRLDFCIDVTKNIFLSLLAFLIIILIYGALIDWFFVEGLIKKLIYVIAISLALHVALRLYRYRS